LVIFTDFYDKVKLIEYNEYCRSKGKGFIYTGSLGLYGFGFVDFGDNHLILDKDGEELKSCIVSYIS
jgi:ubiquitin-activating enzyme E1